MASETGVGRIVLLATPGEATNVVYQALAARFEIAGIILERPISRRILLQRRARRIGWLRAIDQVLFVTVINPIVRRSSSRRIAALRTGLGSDSPIPAELTTVVSSVNDPATLDALRRMAPRVVVVVGTRIIASSVIDAIAVPFINVHAGITPRYRGVHGAYWAIAEGRPGFAGVTVHLVDPGIDTGDILAQARITLTHADTFATFPLLQIAAGIPLLIDVVEAALAGRIEPVASLDASASRLWYHPGAVEYLVRRIRHGVR
jgi:hypothetical protein